KDRPWEPCVTCRIPGNEQGNVGAAGRVANEARHRPAEMIAIDSRADVLGWRRGAAIRIDELYGECRSVPGAPGSRRAGMRGADQAIAEGLLAVLGGPHHRVDRAVAFDQV